MSAFGTVLTAMKGINSIFKRFLRHTFCIMWTMNRIYILAFVLTTLHVACNNNNNNNKKDNNDNNKSSCFNSSNKKKISKRYFSITKQNAYNDLFLDSADVQNFIL